jgi:uncharacterized membrane protein YbaN (DUF454 family)
MSNEINDRPKEEEGANMKKSFYQVMGWVTFVVGWILFIIPGLPGAPVLLLSSYFFSAV